MSRRWWAIAAGVARWWVWAYTFALSEDARRRQRAEMESLVSDHAADLQDKGWRPLAGASVIVANVARGVPGNLLWRWEAPRSAAHERSTAIFDAGLAGCFCVAVLDVGLGPGPAAGLVGASVALVVALLVAAPAAGLRLGVAAGLLTGFMAGWSAGFEDGVDSGLPLGADSVDGTLALLLVCLLLLRLPALVRHGWRRPAPFRA